MAEHTRARTGSGDNRRVAVGLAQIVCQLRDILAGLVVQAVRLQCQTTAAVWWNQNLVPEVLENLDRVDRRFDLEVLACATVEEDDLALATRTFQRRVLIEPAFESATGRLRHRCATVNADDFFHGNTDRLNIKRPVRDRSNRGHDGTDEAGTTNQVIAKRNALFLLHVGASMVDHLGNLHALRADQRAGAT